MCTIHNTIADSQPDDIIVKLFNCKLTATRWLAAVERKKKKKRSDSNSGAAGGIRAELYCYSAAAAALTWKSLVVAKLQQRCVVRRLASPHHNSVHRPGALPVPVVIKPTRSVGSTGRRGRGGRINIFINYFVFIGYSWCHNSALHTCSIDTPHGYTNHPSRAESVVYWTTGTVHSVPAAAAAAVAAPPYQEMNTSTRGDVPYFN